MKYTLKTLIITLILGICAGIGAFAQSNDPDLNGMRAIGTPANPKVKWSWNYYMDYAGFTKLIQELAKAYPDLVKYESMGKSYQGRDMPVITITDFKTGKPEQKPAFWIDGNIHANELQGTQFAMYTAWYLAESFGKMEYITEMLKTRTFYISPSLNPDAHENFIHTSNTTSSSRSGMMPLDDDGDGLVDEDGYDDLDGDGNIVTMRRKSPTGRYKIDPDYPTRMILAKPDEQGEYEMLGFEGIDNDGDGRVNEDNPGAYDPNRDWGWGWQPDYIQGGALYYPGSLPETQNVKKFFYSHPNIAGAQSYHNFGGMFLRPPGAEEDAMYVPQSDIAVYDLIGKMGEKMVPGYKYYVLWKDLYTVYGGEIDWIGLAVAYLCSPTKSILRTVCSIKTPTKTAFKTMNLRNLTNTCSLAIVMSNGSLSNIHNTVTLRLEVQRKITSATHLVSCWKKKDIATWLLRCYMLIICPS